jgi:hypothetical protein
MDATAPTSSSRFRYTIEVYCEPWLNGHGFGETSVERLVGGPGGRPG